MSFGTDRQIAIFIGRTHIFIVCGLTKYLPGSAEVPMNQQILMWFSGLRGAVAFALGVSFLEEDNFSPEIKSAIFGTTVMVILFTVLGLGGLTPYMLKKLNIVSPDSGTEHSHAAIPTDGHSIAEPEKDIDQTVTEHDLTQPVFGWLYRFDAKYFRPFFSVQKEEDLKILDVIRRHDSKVTRAASLLTATRASLVGGGSRALATEEYVLSPLGYSEKQKQDPAADDQEALIDKTAPIQGEDDVVVDTEDMDAVNLN
ncbi:Sodium/hydrogen exchanger 8 [Kappamyces sp. JEL0680]|nr:Sodium/hydrogen exchanger 8 [Kappamyces sp. JEL0680]